MVALTKMAQPTMGAPRLAIRMYEPVMKRQTIDAPGGLVDPDASTAAAVDVTDAQDYDSLLYDTATTDVPVDDYGSPTVAEDTASATGLGAAGGFSADSIPPEILQNPAVQAAISHAAAEYNLTAGVISTASEVPTATTRHVAVAATTSGSRPSDDDDDEDDIETDLSATSSRTRGFAVSRPSSSSTATAGDGEQSFGMKLSTKFGWTAIAAMAAGYFISSI